MQTVKTFKKKTDLLTEKIVQKSEYNCVQRSKEHEEDIHTKTCIFSAFKSGPIRFILKHKKSNNFGSKFDGIISLLCASPQLNRRHDYH